MQVVGEMRKQQEENQANLVCSVDPDEALVAYQQALESSLAAPSAPHPVEGYGPEGHSLAAARRKVWRYLCCSLLGIRSPSMLGLHMFELIITIRSTECRGKF